MSGNAPTYAPAGQGLVTGPPPDGPGIDPHHPINAYPKILDRDKAIVEVTPRRWKVAIMGFAESSRGLAPFDDPEWEIWGLNQLDRHIPRADRWFEIHTNWNEHVVEGTDHLGFLANFSGPIYMVERVKEIPNSVRNPIEDEIAITGHDYFTSTIAYMIALAIREGFTTIGLYGVDLVVGQEWEYQRPNTEYWIGVCVGKEITFIIPPQAAVCKQTWRYGYELEPASLVKISEIEARRADLLSKRQQAMVQLANVDGALQDCEMWNELAVLRVRHASVAYKANG